MVKKISLIICLAFVIFLASGSSELKSTKAADKAPANEPQATEANKVSEEATDESFETVTVDVSDLVPVTEDMLIGYKDESYFNKRAPRYSHNTVLVSVDGEVLDSEKVQALCEKYGLSILYDYDSFDMYALSSEEELSDEDLAKLIDDLSKEDGVFSVERDYFVQITDGVNLGTTFDLF